MAQIWYSIWAILQFSMFQLWGMPAIALIFEIRERIGWYSFKNRPENLVSEAATVIQATITEEVDESLASNYRPNLVFKFINDPLERKYFINYHESLNFRCITAAYDFLQVLVPPGTPFRFIAHRYHPKKPFYSGKIQEGDRFSPFLSDADHAFLKSISWKEERYPRIEVKHVKGDFSNHQYRFQDPRKKTPIDLITLPLLFAATTGVVIAGLFAKSFPKELDLTVARFRNMLAIEVILIIAISLYFIFRQPVYSPPIKTFFEFDVNAQSIKSLSP